MSTLGHQKVDVKERMTRGINPETAMKYFPDGIFEHNVDEFLDGVDLYVAALDFVALQVRKAVFKKCSCDNGSLFGYRMCFLILYV